jgi:hypothetical protein
VDLQGLHLVAVSSQLRHSEFGPRVIDWITAVVPCAHATEVFGGRITAITPDGELEWEKMRPQGVPGSHESTFHAQ